MYIAGDKGASIIMGKLNGKGRFGCTFCFYFTVKTLTKCYNLSKEGYANTLSEKSTTIPLFFSSETAK